MLTLAQIIKVHLQNPFTEMAAQFAHSNIPCGIFCSCQTTPVVDGTILHIVQPHRADSCPRFCNFLDLLGAQEGKDLDLKAPLSPATDDETGWFRTSRTSFRTTWIKLTISKEEAITQEGRKTRTAAILNHFLAMEYCKSLIKALDSLPKKKKKKVKKKKEKIHVAQVSHKFQGRNHWCSESHLSYKWSQ